MTKFKDLKQSLYCTLQKKFKIDKLNSINLTKATLNLGLYKMC